MELFCRFLATTATEELVALATVLLDWMLSTCTTFPAAWAEHPFCIFFG